MEILRYVVELKTRPGPFIFNDLKEAEDFVGGNKTGGVSDFYSEIPVTVGGSVEWKRHATYHVANPADKSP